MPDHNDGGPAFPMNHIAFMGMSLRDYFAGCALSSTASQKQAIGDIALSQGLEPTAVLAILCYALADAMLAERAK